MSLVNTGGSLAELIAHTYDQTNYEWERKNLRFFVRELNNVKRLRLDNNTIGHIQQTSVLSTQEIIGGLNPGCFRTNQFWLELDYSEYSGTPDVGHLGALISVDPDQRGFEFSCLTSYSEQQLQFSHIHNLRLRNEPFSLLAKEMCLFNGFYIFTHGFEKQKIKVGQSFGIDLPDSLIDIIHLQTQWSQDSTRNIKKQDFSKIIDQYYEYADTIARALYVLGSPNASHNVELHRTAEERTLQEKNKRRMQLKRPPDLQTQTVVCNITAPYSPVTTVEEAREHFGTTFVGQSREVRRRDGSLWLRKRDGQPWTRKAHDRAIAAPVDRRNAERIITSSNPSQLDLSRRDRQNSVRDELA